MSKNKQTYTPVKVRYVVDWVQVNKEGGGPTFLPEYGQHRLVRAHTKRYHNCLYLLAGMSSCARDLLDYMAEHMDEENVINTNEHLRRKFAEFIEKTTNTTGKPVVYGDASIKKALSVLTRRGLIRNMRRGLNKVNPEYFCKNDDGHRVALVKAEREATNGQEEKLTHLKEVNNK